MGSHLDLLKTNFSRRTEIQGELRQIDEAATTDKRNYSEDESAKIAELRSELEGIDGRMKANLEMETRSQDIENGMQHLLGAIVDTQTGDVTDTRSIGQRYTGADGYESWSKSPSGSFRVDMHGLDLRTVTNVTTGATSGGALGRPERIDRIGQDFLDRRVFLLDLLPHMPITNGTLEYVQDKSPLADLSDLAVEVTEGAAKPQAGPTLAVVDEPTATIAAWANITRQAAADYPQVQGYLDTRLRYSLKRRTDKQVINGNGSTPNLKGLLSRTGILSYAPGSAEARYASIRHAITLGEAAEAVYEIIVLNPADAELFDLSNQTTNGLHAVPNVAGDSATTAWGLTQVRSNAIASGTAMLVDPMSVAVFDRQEATAYMTDSHASNFVSNILTMLLECRVGLGLFNPSGVASVTFNGTV